MALLLRTPPAAVHKTCRICNRLLPFAAGRKASLPLPRARTAAAVAPFQRGTPGRGGGRVCARAAGTQAPPFTSRRSTGGRSQPPLQRAQELFDLVREIGVAAAESGPTGITRWAPRAVPACHGAHFGSLSRPLCLEMCDTVSIASASPPELGRISFMFLIDAFGCSLSL